MAEINILSGIGSKGPGCIRLTTDKHVWLLDCGHGPEASSPFEEVWLEGADAVFITHDHVDHIGGAAHAIRAGLPIYATAITARALPPGADVRVLPSQGVSEIDGIKLHTGRNGHALGGVWFHFDLGKGLFYSGDWSEESQWFTFDPPPPADIALIDASYHLNDIVQQQCKQELNAQIASLPGTLLFPVPPSGRAGELALHLMQFGEVSLDDTCRAAIDAALKAGATAGIDPAAAAILPLLNKPFNPDARFLICDNPNADGGMAWAIVQRWHDSGRLGRDGHVIFTGHMTAHARSIADHPGGRFARWNVHPPLRDQIGLVTRLGATRYAPLFCTLPENYLIENGFSAEVLLHGRATL